MSGRRTAVLLAAGTGSRMRTKLPKQFMELNGEPLICYALRAIEDSEIIDDCVVVTGKDDLARMRDEIVGRYGFRKVRAVIEGGSERCFSVANAMRWLAADGDGKLKEPSRPADGDGELKEANRPADGDGELKEANRPADGDGELKEPSRPADGDGADGDDRSFVFIHDGARPFLSEEILDRTYRGAMKCGACVAAVPSKDTVKLSDEKGFAVCTPDRSRVWSIQTPQVFERKLIIRAYADFERALAEKKEPEQALAMGDVRPPVTDDASVVELFTDTRVKLVEGAYSNIKVTTPEDLFAAQAFLQAQESG